MKYDSFFADGRLFHHLAAGSDSFHCVGDQTLFEQGEPAYGLHLVRSGEVVLQLRSPEGNVLATFSAFQGSILGLPAVIERAPYTLSAIAREGSEIGFIDTDTFHQLMRADPLLYPSVMSLLATEVRAARAGFSDWTDGAGWEREEHRNLTAGLNCGTQLANAQMPMTECAQGRLVQG